MILVLLGYGNMARCILKALLNSENSKNPYKNIFVIGRNFQKAQDFCKEFQNLKKSSSLQAFENLNALSDTLDSENFDVLFCVKPKGAEFFKDAFKTLNKKARIAYSVMAGVKIENLQGILDSEIFVRLMPNVGAKFSESATCAFMHCQNSESKSKFLPVVENFVESFGACVFVDSENLIDSSIATSGSSPAFLALVADALIDCGVLNGLTYTQSKNLVAQTFTGFAKLLESNTPAEIKNLVTSPGGTTAQGLAVLEEKGVRGAIVLAGNAAVNHAKK